MFIFSALMLVLDCIWLLCYIHCFHWQCHMPDLFLIISSNFYFFSNPWNNLLTIVFMFIWYLPLCCLDPEASGEFMFTSPGLPSLVLGVDCAMVIPTVGIFGWSPPEASSCGESTQKPPFPAELQETVVVEGGRGTEDISSRVTQAKGNASGLFQLAHPVLAGLKEVLVSQGLVDTNIFWNSSEKEMSALKNTGMGQYREWFIWS